MSLLINVILDYYSSLFSTRLLKNETNITNNIPDKMLKSILKLGEYIVPSLIPPLQTAPQHSDVGSPALANT